MCDDLCTVFKDTAKSEIAEDEEGNVLYFVEKDKEGNSKVISLCKLKTLEYRLFRKMREKLRNFFHAKECEISPIEDVEGFKQKLKKFKSESIELAAEHELPRPLEYYVSVFECAMAFIKEKPAERIEILQQAYVTFSEQLLVYFKETEQGKKFDNNKEFFFSNVLDV